MLTVILSVSCGQDIVPQGRTDSYSLQTLHAALAAAQPAESPVQAHTAQLCHSSVSLQLQSAIEVARTKAASQCRSCWVLPQPHLAVLDCSPAQQFTLSGADCVLFQKAYHDKQPLPRTKTTLIAVRVNGGPHLNLCWQLC